MEREPKKQKVFAAALNRGLQSPDLFWCTLQRDHSIRAIVDIKQVPGLVRWRIATIGFTVSGGSVIENLPPWARFPANIKRFQVGCCAGIEGMDKSRRKSTIVGTVLEGGAPKQDFPKRKQNNAGTSWPG